MAAAALLLARVGRQGVASAAVAGMARRRPEAASLLGLSALAAAVEPCASVKVGFLVSVVEAREQCDCRSMVVYGAGCVEGFTSSEG